MFSFLICAIVQIVPVTSLTLFMFEVNSERMFNANTEKDFVVWLFDFVFNSRFNSETTKTQVPL